MPIELFPNVVGSVSVRGPVELAPGLSGGVSVTTVVQFVPSVDRWSAYDVSAIELSVNATVTWRLLPFPVIENDRPEALGGATATATGRIISISSWDRMWQWKTYSQP